MVKSVLRPLILRHLDRALSAAGPSDSELLERFIGTRDEGAFAALVQRHGPMVLGVCRRLLDAHTAEDAFQATFLVLVRKADSIRRSELLGKWLYGVACRVTRKAWARSERWRRRETQLPERPSDETDDLTWRDLRPLLDEELSRLSEKYRQPLVLCYLQGRSYEEAARQLGCPAGTVSGRLARARDLLRERLLRRGIVLSAPLLMTMLTDQAAPAVVPSLLVRATVHSAALFAARETAAVSSSILALTEGVVTTMFSRTLKTISVVLLGVGLLAGSDHRWPQGGPVFPCATLAAAETPGGTAPAEKKALPDSVWTDLADTDNVRVTRAIFALAAAGPKDSIAYLTERLQPVKVDETRVQQLLADLDSAQFAKRQQAALDLEYLGKFVKPQLEKALTGGPSAELRKRIEQLLSKLPKEEKNQPANPAQGNGMQVSATNGQVTINGKVGKLIVNGVEVALTPPPVEAGPSPLWIRAVRSVTVLEEMGTPEAKQLLEKLAQGEAEALPTREAKAALERLRSKG